MFSGLLQVFVELSNLHGTSNYVLYWIHRVPLFWFRWPYPGASVKYPCIVTIIWRLQVQSWLQERNYTEILAKITIKMKTIVWKTLMIKTIQFYFHLISIIDKISLYYLDCCQLHLYIKPNNRWKYKREVNLHIDPTNFILINLYSVF